MSSEHERADRFMDAMNFIDDDLLLSAEEARNGKYKKAGNRRTAIVRFATYAIAAAVLVGIGVNAFRTHRAGNGGSSVANVQGTTDTADEMMSYVDVAMLLAEPAQESSGDIVIRDFDEDEEITGFRTEDEEKRLIAAMPYDGSRVQVVMLSIGGEETLYARRAVSEEGYALLPECISDALEGESGWYLVRGHEEPDYLIYEDPEGNWSLWERRS